MSWSHFLPSHCGRAGPLQPLMTLRVTVHPSRRNSEQSTFAAGLSVPVRDVPTHHHELRGTPLATTNMLSTHAAVDTLHARVVADTHTHMDSRAPLGAHATPGVTTIAGLWPAMNSEGRAARGLHGNRCQLEDTQGALEGSVWGSPILGPQCSERDQSSTVTERLCHQPVPAIFMADDDWQADSAMSRGIHGH